MKQELTCTLYCTCVDSSWAEGLPDNGFTDVRGDEQRDTRSETVTFLEKFVEQQHDQTRDKQLDDDEQAHPRSDLARVSVHSCSNTPLLQERINSSKHLSFNEIHQDFDTLVYILTLCCQT